MQMKSVKKFRAFLGGFILFLALMFTGGSVNVKAAAPKLSKKKITIYVGHTGKLKVNNARKKVKWTSSKKQIDLLDLILRKDNLNEAYKQVKRNKGKGGIDGMQVDELLPFLRENQETLIQEIREGRYKPNPVRRVEIPKEAKGKF